MADPARRRDTYDDVLAAPTTVVAELLHGVLHTHPRPAVAHATASSVLGEELGPPFRRGKGGPGGWIFADEPELHLGVHVLVPDLAGWRRDRVPALPDGPFVALAPDWVCEVLSPSTATIDKTQKLPIYAEHGVGHAWLIDPRLRTLDVYRRHEDRWLLASSFAGDDPVRAEPFDAIALELGALWADVGPAAP